jgi:hypothetical protein
VPALASGEPDPQQNRDAVRTRGDVSEDQARGAPSGITVACTVTVGPGSPPRGHRRVASARPPGDDRAPRPGRAPPDPRRRRQPNHAERSGPGGRAGAIGRATYLFGHRDRRGGAAATTTGRRWSTAWPCSGSPPSVLSTKVVPSSDQLGTFATEAAPNQEATEQRRLAQAALCGAAPTSRSSLDTGRIRAVHR